MADRYWVGGTGSWDASDTTHWSASSGGAGGASVPTSSDNVIFDTASNGASYTCTITAAATTADLTIGNPSVGSLTLAGSAALAVYGSFSIANITRTYTGTITMAATSTGKTLTFNGETMGGPFIFDGVGGGWTIQDAMNIGSFDITLTNGSLNTNGQTITCRSVISSNTNTRTLTLGASTINCNRTSTAWNLGTTTGLTFSGASSTINCTGSGGDFSGGGLTYNVVTFTGASGHTISGANTFATLTVTGTATKTNSVSFAADQTITGTFTASGNSSVNRLLLCSSQAGTQRTISAGTVTLSNVDLSDISGTGAGSWDLSAITGLSGDGGGNSGITFTGAQTNYWVGGTGNWDAVAEWANSSGGAASSGRVPLLQDTAIFDANSFTAGSLVVTQNMSRIPTTNFTGVLNTPTFTTSTSASVYGSLTLVSGMTFTASTQSYTFAGRGSHTLTSAGKTWSKDLIIDCGGGTLTLQDDLTLNGGGRFFDLLSGTFDMNDNDINGDGSIFFETLGSGVKTLSFGSGLMDLTNGGTASGSINFLNGENFTLNLESGTLATAAYNADPTVFTAVNAGTSTIQIDKPTGGTAEFEGGGFTFYNLVIARGTATDTTRIYSGDTFESITDTGTVAHTVQFGAGDTTTTKNFSISGSLGNVVTINSITGGTAAILSCPIIKNISSDYLSIQDIEVTGGACWYAGANSTDVSGNKYWRFTAPIGECRHCGVGAAAYGAPMNY